ncbi:MAG: hypothetical protein COA78_11820 [Blastopirellula sp.]|nr:MAG: hypothetical protein COA78_11820 [Blastopirellula sp.]
METQDHLYIAAIRLFLRYSEFIPAVSMIILAVLLSNRRWTVSIVAGFSFFVGVVFTPIISTRYRLLAIEEPQFYLMKMRHAIPTVVGTFLGLLLYALYLKLRSTPDKPSSSESKD